MQIFKYTHPTHLVLQKDLNFFFILLKIDWLTFSWIIFLNWYCLLGAEANNWHKDCRRLTMLNTSSTLEAFEKARINAWQNIIHYLFLFWNSELLHFVFLWSFQHHCKCENGIMMLIYGCFLEIQLLSLSP